MCWATIGLHKIQNMTPMGHHCKVLASAYNTCGPPSILGHHGDVLVATNLRVQDGEVGHHEGVDLCGCDTQRLIDNGLLFNALW